MTSQLNVNDSESKSKSNLQSAWKKVILPAVISGAIGALTSLVTISFSMGAYSEKIHSLQDDVALISASLQGARNISDFMQKDAEAHFAIGQRISVTEADIQVINANLAHVEKSLMVAADEIRKLREKLDRP